MWAEFQLNEICAQISDKAIEKALTKVPKDLNATFERILDSISQKPEGQYALARRVLICVAYSRSPIPITLLRYAVSVDEDSESLEALESSIPTEKTIVNACANLVTIVKNTRRVRLVRFVHFSVQEFLKRHQSSIDPFRPGLESAHREIARMFVSLLHILYSQPPVDTAILKHLSTLHQWQYHLICGKLSSLPVDDCMVTLVTSFFEWSPPIYISDRFEKIFLRFSPSALALIFDLPGEYQHYQLLPVYRNTLGYEHFNDIYGKYRFITDDTFEEDISEDDISEGDISEGDISEGDISEGDISEGDISEGDISEGDISEGDISEGDISDFEKHLVFDDRFAIHYATVVHDVIPIAQRLYAHSYPIDCSYYTTVDPVSNVHYKGKVHNGCFWNLMPKEYQVSPLCASRSEAMAKFLLDNGANTNPQFFNNELHDPLVWFAKRGYTQLTEHVSDRIVYQHTRRYSAALVGAAKSGHVKIVRLLMDKGVDVNATDGQYETALMAAAALRGNVECMQLLLDRGADVNALGGKYGTALQATAHRGNVKCIQLLLDRGADVNALGGEYGTALQAAACGGHFGFIQLLLDQGADVNAQGGQYGTALQAAVFGNVECIQLLLDQGADVNALGGKYGTALQAAASHGSVVYIQLLLDRGADINALGGEYGTALQAAAHRGNVECIQLLLDRGADVNAQGGYYGTALQAAAAFGEVECIQLLLDQGADVNAQGGYYGTALQAAAFGNVECIQLLLDQGADVNAQGGQYGTALQAAASWGNVEFIQLLLDWGADVNAQGGKYGTALQAAAYAYEGNVECMQLLLDWGADVNALGGQCGTALQVAASRGHVDCIRLLLDKGAHINTPGGKYGSALHAAAHNGTLDMNCLKLLLDEGADVNFQGGLYGTALQAASYLVLPRVVKVLLGRGADVNAQGGKYGTALQAALAPAPADDKRLQRRKNPYTPFDVLEMLLDHGADITAYVQDSEYGDALTAAQQLWKDDPEALDRLMKLFESRRRGEAKNPRKRKYQMEVEYLCIRNTRAPGSRTITGSHE